MGNVPEIIKNLDWLKESDLSNFAKYAYMYSKDISLSWGCFDWNDGSFKHFCKDYKIEPKGNKAKKIQKNHFWFSANKPNGQIVNDFAVHFMRHIRNSFAHGNITYLKQDKRMFYAIKDFDENGQQTMSGNIRSDLLWEMLNLLYKTKTK